MTVYSAESFFRAKISQSILKATACPITVRISKLPTLTNWLLTISPNTENEEIVEYNNPQVGTMTIDIIKRGIKPDSILLTTDTVDYNNTTYQFLHTQNDIIRGDVNHIHINQGIGNSTLATEAGVGISKLSVAAVDAGDPIAVGNNDPRLWDASTTTKWLTKLSVAPVSAVNPIAVGTNDPRLTADTIVSANWFAGTVSGANAHTISTTVTWLLKGNGTAISAATAWTDYYAPTWTDVVVADGGTWRSSHTAYAPIFGGTSSTSPQQSGTVWTAWQVMTSNWAWALPTFQPWIVKNWTFTSISASWWAYGWHIYSAETWVLSSPTIANISLYAQNYEAWLEYWNWSSWVSLYYNNNTFSTIWWYFLIKEWINYRIHLYTTFGWAWVSGSWSLTYTI